jgi:hypothetical protein
MIRNCRIGMTTKPFGRKQYWESKYPRLHCWHIVSGPHNREEAQEIETRLAKEEGCDAHPGGADPQDAKEWDSPEIPTFIQDPFGNPFFVPPAKKWYVYKFYYIPRQISDMFQCNPNLPTPGEIGVLRAAAAIRARQTSSQIPSGDAFSLALFGAVNTPLPDFGNVFAQPTKAEQPSNFLGSNPFLLTKK